MTTPLVTSHRNDDIVRITIDHQKKLNALNAEVIGGLEEAFASAAEDERCRTVVLTGAGDKAFVAGADIAELQALDPESALDFLTRGHQLMDRIENLGKPVIAAVNGYALGGGCELAMACTLRIASARAMIGLPEVRLGVIPGYGGTQRLARLVGRGRALHMILTGEPIDAGTALEWGLVNHVAPPEKFEEAVGELAGRLARSAPLAMHAAIQAVNRGADLPLADALEIEKLQFAGICGTHDMLEGTAAFLEKRKPRFRGR